MISWFGANLGNGETLSLVTDPVKNSNLISSEVFREATGEFCLRLEATTTINAASVNRQFLLGLWQLAVNLFSA